MRATGMDCLGTMKANNEHFPKDLIFPQKPKSAHGSGSRKSCQNILTVSWYNNKPVHFSKYSAQTVQNIQEIPHRSKERLAEEATEEQLLYHAHHYCMTITSTWVGLTVQIRITAATVLHKNEVLATQSGVSPVRNINKQCPCNVQGPPKLVRDSYPRNLE